MLARTARDVMTREVLAVDEDLPLSDLATFLVDHQISGAVVRDRDGRYAGVVSLADLAAAEALAGESPEAAASRKSFYDQIWEASFDEYDVEAMRIRGGELSVRDVMTATIVSVEADAPVAEIARRMLDSHLHRVLVREGGELVGIVTTSDLLGLLAEPAAA